MRSDKRRLRADANVMLISDMEQKDYMSVVGMVMISGAATNIKTITCHTGHKAAAAVAKATDSSIDYKTAG